MAEVREAALLGCLVGGANIRACDILTGLNEQLGNALWDFPT